MRRRLLLRRIRSDKPIKIMNQIEGIDSKQSLDGRDGNGHVWPIIQPSFQLYCQRVDGRLNMARYYALSLQPTLFGEIAVVRAWGRIGHAGGEKSDVYESEREAVAHFLKLARQKRGRGYRPVRSCGNDGKTAGLTTLAP